MIDTETGVHQYGIDAGILCTHPDFSEKTKPSAIVSIMDKMKLLPVIFMSEARPGSSPRAKLAPDTCQKERSLSRCIKGDRT